MHENELLRVRGLTVILIVLLVVVPLTVILNAPPARAGGSTPVCAPGVPPGYVDTCAVIGQPDFDTLTAGQSPSPTTIGNPTAVAFDSKGDLWVVDNSNNRVLEYEPPFSTGQAAVLVIGQTSLTGSDDASPSGGLFGPTGIAFDSSGNLWISDGINGVAECVAPLSTGEAVTQVIGPKTITTSSTSAGSKLRDPQGIAFDAADNLWVADYDHGRVLVYGSGVTITASSSSSSSTTSSTSGGGVPVFPYQLVTAAVFTAMLAASYLLIRRGRTRPQVV